MDPSFITCHYPPCISLSFLFKTTQKFPWNCDCFIFYLISQFSWYPPGKNSSEFKKFDNVAYSFFRDFQFKSNVFLFDLMLFLNHLFNAFFMRPICCSHWCLPDLCLSLELASLTFSLNCHTQCLAVLIWTHLTSYTACIWQWMSMGGTYLQSRTP